jgi:hypothetical protein
MTRIVYSSVCMLLCTALPAHAALINVTATRTSYDGTLDQVVLRVESFQGAEFPPLYGDSARLTGLVGSWTFGDGAVNLPGTSSNWATKLLNNGNWQDSDGGVAGVGPTTPQSWFNFSTRTADAYWRSGPVGGTLYHGFAEGFHITGSDGCNYGVSAVDWTPGGTTDDGDGYGFDNTLLAILYVSKDTTVGYGQTLFTGSATYAFPYAGPSPGPYPTTVQVVPEPSTLALLCVGVLGLLAYARQRRK